MLILIQAGPTSEVAAGYRALRLTSISQKYRTGLHSLVVEHLPNMYKYLSSIPITIRKRNFSGKSEWNQWLPSYLAMLILLRSR